ncbi:MAG: sigma-70 family RNA polymerase sigma factor [Candidatus Latescibacteria bacterium]|nr:sigma-70 family RNA polymerase sigma factor [Candidatus Latescibacterota bacterium]
MSNNLETLVKQAQTGDLEAFTTLVRRFQDMAMGYAQATLNDYHLAQDAAQEAFIEAHATLSKLEHPLAFPAWLRRIVFKRCDRLSRSRRPLRILSLEAALEVASSDKSPAQIAEENQVNKLVHEALDRLPDQERQIVYLHYIADHPQREIADFLGVPVHTVKNRMRTARGHLKERLLSMAKETIRETRPSKDSGFVDQVLRLIAPRKAEHSEEIFKIFDSLGRQELTLLARDGRILDSTHDWKTSRIGLVGDQLVTYMGIYDITMRVGTARVRVAGENLSYTHADHGERFGESMDQTIHSALAAMRENGYDLTLNLAGPEYARYGYVPVWRSIDWEVDTAELLQYGTDVQLQVFDPVYREDLAEIYNSGNATVTGTVVRPVYRKNKEPLGFQGWLWTDQAGKPLGYVSGGDGDSRYVYVDDQAGPPDQVIKALAQIGQRAMRDIVHFRGLPYNSPLGKRLRRMQTCKISWNQPNLTYRARIINLASLFEKLIPELSRRLQRFPLLQWQGDLLISSGDEAVTLRIKGGDISLAEGGQSQHAIRGGQEIVQLILGSDAPEDVVEAGNIELSGDAEQLIHLLFPAQYPMFGNQDL